MRFLPSFFQESKPSPLVEKESRFSPEVTARLERLPRSSKAELAATLLTAPTALMQLSPEEARVVVTYMRPGRMRAGKIFIQEGDSRNNDFMMLILEGEVTVESRAAQGQASTTLNVLGPGSLIGEMALLDGEPRSATCTTATEVQCATLVRADFERLLNDDPRTGCKLLMAVSYRLTHRVRDLTDKLRLSGQLIHALQGELDSALPTGRRLRRSATSATAPVAPSPSSPPSPPSPAPNAAVSAPFPSTIPLHSK